MSSKLIEAVEALKAAAVQKKGAYWKEYSEGLDDAVALIRQHEAQGVDEGVKERVMQWLFANAERIEESHGALSWSGLNSEERRALSKKTDELLAIIHTPQPAPQVSDFDYHRVPEWVLSEPRKPAHIAFTAGTNRNVARLLEEMLTRQPAAQVSAEAQP